MGGGIKHWPEDERPREKLLKQGAEALSEAELLALVIRTGNPSTKQSAVDIGRLMLQEFGSLRNLAGATAAEICRVKGRGPAKASAIKASLEIASRINTDRLANGDRFTSPEQVYQHYHYSLRDRRKEYFLALLLDGKNRILKEVRISEGSLNHKYSPSPRSFQPGGPRVGGSHHPRTQPSLRRPDPEPGGSGDHPQIEGCRRTDWCQGPRSHHHRRRLVCQFHCQGDVVTVPSPRHG
jgi:DNA repair protein RadC